jgi:hypothetical protein
MMDVATKKLGRLIFGWLWGSSARMPLGIVSVRH